MAKRPKTPDVEKEPPDDLLVGFGQKVREARDRAGLTLAQLGELTDLAPSYIFTMEKEGANVTLKTLGKIASALKLSARDLLPESEHDALTSSGIASLVAALEHTAAVLGERQSQEATILEHLHGFSTLRTRLQRLAGTAREE